MSMRQKPSDLILPRLLRVHRPKILVPGGSLGFEGLVQHRIIKPDGFIKPWEHAHNAMVTEGMAHVIDVVFKGASPDTTWFVGLIISGALACDDTVER